MKYKSILDTVGRTPIVQLSSLAPQHVSLYAKVESFNPMGSVKDRFALAVIERAEQTGALKPGQTVIEATSGNTGIGLAMVCARKGYPLVIVMAENFSIERRRLMRFLGAKVVLTPASQKGSGMLAKAVELAETHGWFLTRQFENEANADIHTATTAAEIIQDFTGERLDYWVSAFGTGGTLKGVARALRAARPETKIAVAEPDNSAMLSSGIAQPPADGDLVVSHPAFRPHPVQGASPDFIAKLAADAVEAGLIDQIVPINGGEALRLARELAVREGIFAGISSGAAIAAALRIAQTAQAGSTILCMLPDTGERYLSTPLFDAVPVEMTAEERKISDSTPRCRFEPPRPAAPAQVPVQATTQATTQAMIEATTEAPDRTTDQTMAPRMAPTMAPTTEPPMEQAPNMASVDGEAGAFVAKTIATEPVVMFALEWCEFCWSVRRLFAALSIPFKAVDLNSVAYQKDDLGGRVRSALCARTGAPTIPQIFIGGDYVGGCMDVFDAARSGALHKRLGAASVEFKDVGVELATLLPNWLNAPPTQTAV